LKGRKKQRGRENTPQRRACSDCRIQRRAGSIRSEEESEQRALSATLFQRVLHRDFPACDEETLALLAEDFLREVEEHAVAEGSRLKSAAQS